MRFLAWVLTVMMVYAFMSAIVGIPLLIVRQVWRWHQGKVRAPAA